MGSKVEITGGVINGTIKGNGDESNGTEVKVEGGTLAGTAKIEANKIELSSSTSTSDSFAGTLSAHQIDLKNVLKGSATLQLTGSTLNLRTLNNTAAKIEVAKLTTDADLNFYIPKEAVSGDTMLTLSADTTISNSRVTVGVQNGSRLKVNDTINLIKMAGAATLTADNLTYLTPGESVIQTENLAKRYELTTEVKDNSLVTTVTRVGPGENAKSYVETMAANVALLNMSSDLMAGMGFEQAATAASLEAAGEQAEDAIGSTASRRLVPFAAMGGSSLRSHSGSYVDSHGWGIDVGMAKTINNSAGRLLFGPMVEYAKGSYDSHLDNGTRGDGKGRSWAVGAFAKQEYKDGTYLEGSLRAGRISTDYHSADMGEYKTAAPYLSAHIGLGQEKKIGVKDSLDYYGKFFYTHQNGDQVAIHDKGNSDLYSFESVNSSRLRLGLRWNHQLNKRSVIYLGAAWQYEFAGTARASYEGEYTLSPSVKGGSGMYELGWRMSAKNGSSVDLTATGWSGKQEGWSLGAKFNWML